VIFCRSCGIFHFAFHDIPDFIYPIENAGMLFSASGIRPILFETRRFTINMITVHISDIISKHLMQSQQLFK